MALTINHTRGLARKPKFISEDDAAHLIGISPKQLRRLAYERRGPKFIKIGRKHLFREEDVVAWLESRLR